MRILPRKLRPAGNPIVLTKLNSTNAILESYDVHFYQSGTAALAASIIASIQRKSADNKPPEVILPAYACPDLISAILYAGAKPVLVDLEPDLPWMSLDGLEQAISSHTVAIIAVNFLGIPERINVISTLCKMHDIVLIEDSAQGFPAGDPETYWQGDLVVVSFGRGKPVNMLSGGAVLSKHVDLGSLLPTPGPARNSLISRLSYLEKARIYNLLINPFLYHFLTYVPGLNLGETAYKPLPGLKSCPESVLKRLSSNIENYRHTTNGAHGINQLLDSTKYQALITDLASTTNHDFSRPLLRYPLLARDAMLRNLLMQGLSRFGASVMYGRLLFEIPGLEKILTPTTGSFTNAENFANRLITLPTHSGLVDADLSGIRKFLDAISA